MADFILNSRENPLNIDAKFETEDKNINIPYFVDLRQHGIPMLCAKFILTNGCYADFIKHNKILKRLYLDDKRFNHISNNNKPAVGIRYDYAVKYCNWLSGLINKRVDLPTSDEWELIATISAKQSEYATSTGDISTGLANYNLNLGMTNEVDKYQPNNLGIHDMTGNVLEWTKTEANEIVGVPTTSKEKMNSVKLPVKKNIKNLKIDRVLKGGAWPFSEEVCRIKYIVSMSPRSDYYFIGMRPVIRL